MAAAAFRETAFDEVFDSQKTFRALLGALSRPGVVHWLPKIAWAAPPAERNPHVLTVMKTLCDERTAFGVTPESDEPWIRYLAVNTRAACVGLEAADYVAADGGRFLPVVSRLKAGSLEEPESSATLVLSAARISSAGEKGSPAGCTLALRGPGVRDTAVVHIAGLDPRYIADLEAASRLYPFGVDAFVVDWSGAVIGIPRSNRPEAA